MPRILIFAGEASGDLHGASLAKSLLAQCPEIELEGLGGAKMQAAGVRLLSGIERLDIIGVPTLSELRRAIAVFRKLSHYIATTSFDAVVLIDNPGLNLRLARVAKRSGRRVIYYIAPQIWAWNEGRIKKMRRYVDRLFCKLVRQTNDFGVAVLIRPSGKIHFANRVIAPLLDLLGRNLLDESNTGAQGLMTPYYNVDASSQQALIQRA